MKQSKWSLKTKLAIGYVVMLVLSLGIILFNLFYITIYNSYDGKAEAVVTNIETQIIHVKTFPITEYKVFYTYQADGETYEGESSWTTSNQEIFEIKIGQEIMVRYYSSDPGSSVLEPALPRRWIAMSLPLCLAIGGLIMLKKK